MTVEGRTRLETEATTLVEILAKALHENGAGQYQELYDARQKVRNLNLFSAMTARYIELHPEPQPEIDAVIAAVCKGHSDGTAVEGESGKILGAVFGSVFVDLPSEAPPPTKKRFFARLTGR